MNRSDISPLTVNRLSVYLRVLRALEAEGVERISSRQIAERFNLSAAQMRKDLARFGEFGIRGVGYDVLHLRTTLERVLGLDVERSIVIVGAGNLGTALARFPGFHTGRARVAAIVDIDPGCIGRAAGPDGGLTVRDSVELETIVEETGAEIGVLAVPPEAAQENYEHLVRAGVRAVLNFAPVTLREDPTVRVKTVDLLIFVEELAFYLV